MTKKSLAARFREELKKRKAEPPKVVEREFAGMPCEVQPLDIRAWIIAGLIPDYLATHMFAVGKGLKKQDDATPKEYQAGIQAQKDILCASLVNPRLILEGEPQEGEFLYSEFVKHFMDVAQGILDWQMAGCPDVKVAVKGGEVAVADLKNFPVERDGSGGPGDSSRSATT
ncbi:MAG TPA: hypothetical protein VJS44_04625 [Pyrinomonadaceae bacterium]|nr:hypothetical protein [Pyrinomonadaceae bacterium]